MSNTYAGNYANNSFLGNAYSNGLYSSDSFKCVDAEDNYIKSWRPSVIEESNNGYTTVNLLTRQLTDRKIYLLGEVDNIMANNFVQEILFLAKTNEPIDIYINSQGGSIISGMVIVDTIRALENKVPINITCIGTAASMGAVILAAGEKGRRKILPHSKVMIHEPLISGGMGGNATSIKKTSDSILETKTMINEFLAERTGKTIEEINEDTLFDNWMSAEEALSYGLVDEVANIL